MLALATMAFFGSTHADPRDLLHPVTRTNLFFAEASLMIHGTRLSGQIAGARTGLAGTYALDQQSFDLLRGHRVHIEPWEASLA